MSKVNVVVLTLNKFCKNIERIKCVFSFNKLVDKETIPSSKLKSYRYFKFAVRLVPAIGLHKVAAESDLKDSNQIAFKNQKKNLVLTEETIEDKTGWDRLVAVYKRDEYGNLSKELNAVFQGTCMACLFGIMYGGVTSSKKALIDFMERNQATIFENHIDAKRRLQNHVTIHFGKGAIRWAGKLSAFTCGFMLLMLSLTAYRGETKVIDYTVSGTVVGALLRLRLGPRGWVAGGLVGGGLGLFCGLTTKGLLTLHGSSLDDVLSFQYEIEKSRRDVYKQAVGQNFEKNLEKEVVNLMKNNASSQDDKGF